MFLGQLFSPGQQHSSQNAHPGTPPSPLVLHPLGRGLGIYIGHTPRVVPGPGDVRCFSANVHESPQGLSRFSSSGVGLGMLRF